jgi:hypothetical protein
LKNSQLTRQLPGGRHAYFGDRTAAGVRRFAFGVDWGTPVQLHLIRDTDNAQYRRDDELFYEMSVEGEVVLSVFFKTLSQNLSSATGYAL